MVNVTKDAIWQRFAVRPQHASVSPPDPEVVAEAAGIDLPEKVTIPAPKLPREQQQEQFLRDMELDPERLLSSGRQPAADAPLAEGGGYH